MKSTRFKELGYDRIDPKTWRVFDITDDYPAAIGPYYQTERELLGDLERYAAEYGCPGAVKVKLPVNDALLQALRKALRLIIDYEKPLDTSVDRFGKRVFPYIESDEVLEIRAVIERSEKEDAAPKHH